MIGTASLHQLVELADAHGWRLVLVGDPRQLQAVGRGGLFNELCATGRVHELSRIHRFHRALGSRRLAAAARRRPERARRLRGPRPDRRRPVRRPPRPDRRRLARPHRRRQDGRHHRRHQRARRRHQRRHPTRPAHRRPARPRRRGAASPAASTPTSATSSPPAATTASFAPAPGSRSATATCGSSPPPTPTGRSPCPTSADTAPSPSPPTTSAEHVRLGYAATEHGHQGDTVDVGIALVSTATTHRGLYVGMTRGRDDNHVHVVTETTDPAEARDVLECVLAHDRADVPAVTQRRDLAHQIPPPEPGPSWRVEPTPLIPDWVAPWRTQLEQQRDDLDQLPRPPSRAASRGRRRAGRAPAGARRGPRRLAALRRTDRRAIEDELRTDLRPAMWKANHDATHAGFGHRHSASRRANDATERVERRRSSHRVDPHRRCRRQTTTRRARSRGAQPPRPRPPVTRRLRPRTVPP